jgi:hypothetical protein
MNKFVSGLCIIFVVIFSWCVSSSALASEADIYCYLPNGNPSYQPCKFTTSLPTANVSEAGYLDAYSGIGALGPYWKMTATTSSPIILGTIRYTGNRLIKIRQFQFLNVVTSQYTAAQFITLAIRKVTGYTAIDTGGTDVTAYFGAPKKSTSPAVANIQAVVAGVPGTPSSIGLTAGTRTVLNSILQNTMYVGTTTIGNTTTNLSATLDEPLILSSNEGVEILLLVSATDTTGSFAITTQFDWTVEDF